MTRDWDRREFLAAMPGAVLGTHLAGASALSRPAVGPTDDARRALPIGAQVYTVRNEMQADAAKTLAALAEIGYREVELFGEWTFGGAELRATLDDVGLRAASTHAGMFEVRERWGELLDSVQALGVGQIVVPSLPGDARDAEGLRRLAEELNAAAETARAAGLRMGFHNHDFEMRALGDAGPRPIDVLLEHTDPELFDWQMDIFWTVHGGADPLEELERYRGRVRSVHVKDRTADGTMVDVGAGVIDFTTVLARAEAQGLAHQFVEHDRPGDAIESMRASFVALRRMLG